MNECDYPTKLEAARAHFAGDLFATEAAGIKIDEAEENFAVCSMEIRPILLNAKGGVMGGALFTICDLASAIAAYVPGQRTSTVSASMQFLTLAKGTRLIARTTCERAGRTMSYYTVRVEDDLGTQVAVGQFTQMRLTPHK